MTPTMLATLTIDRSGVGGPARDLVVGRCEHHPSADRTGDDAADVTADRDAGDGERDDEVHQQGGTDPGGQRVDAPAPLADRGGRQQAEHGTRCAGRDASLVEEDHPERSAEQRGEVEQEEPDAAERRFEHRAEHPQEEHVQPDVHDPEVQEPGGDQPVPAVWFGDELRAVVALPGDLLFEHLTAETEVQVGVGDGAAERPGVGRPDEDADEHRDVHADQDLRDQQRLLGRPEPGPGLQVGLGRLGALETMAPDLGLDEAVGARRLPAPRAPPACLTSGMSVADHPGTDRAAAARRWCGRHRWGATDGRRTRRSGPIPPRRTPSGRIGWWRRQRHGVRVSTEGFDTCARQGAGSGGAVSRGASRSRRGRRRQR